MPTIDPFDFAPLGAFNRLHAYFMCTWFRAQYDSADGNPFLDDRIAALIGATSFQVIARSVDPGGFYLPRLDLATLADGRRVVCVQGTAITDELVGEIITAGLVHFDDWQGRVHPYFGYVARRSWDRLPADIPNGWLAAGHSLGGAICSLMGIHGAVKYFTAGQPREGDGTYADGRPNPVKLRLANDNDPVPTIPLSSGGPLDFLDLDLPFFLTGTFYRHWGQKRVLFPDGSVIYPPHQDQFAPIDFARAVRRLVTAAGTNHQAAEYCRRLRLGFPLRFPMTKPDADFPGLFELDQLNNDMNPFDNPPAVWNIEGLLPGGIPVTRREPVPPGVPPNTDPFQFLCE